MSAPEKSPENELHEQVESARIKLSRLKGLHDPSDCQKAGAPLDFCCVCHHRLDGLPHHSCHLGRTR
jgi:hypothetical protein